MKKPRAVRRGDKLTREVPELTNTRSEFSYCRGCMYDAMDTEETLKSCVYPTLDAPKRQCMDRDTIYIEASDEAWAQYIAMRITS